MKKLLSQIISAGLGLWLAVLFVPGVSMALRPDTNFFGFALTSQWELFLVLGIVLGLLNYFVRPALDALALPLKIITLGLFSIVINMAMIWLLDLIFVEISIPLLWPLLYTSIIIWFLNFVIIKLIVKDN